MFGFRETIRKESGRRERLNNILFSIVWFASNKVRKESFMLGPTQNAITPKLDEKWEEALLFG